MWKELSVDEWFTEIERCLEYRLLFGLEDHWNELEALFADVHSSSGTGSNIIASTGDSLLSTLSVPVPQITVKARRGGTVERARILESVDNQLENDLGVQEEFEDAIHYGFLWGKGVLKIGYDSEWGWNPKHDFGENLGASLTQFDSRGRRIEFQSRTRPGYPWMQAVMPHDILVPWGTRKIRSAPYVIHRVIRHVEDIKADVKYNGKRDLRAVMSMKDFVQSYQSTLKVYRMGHDLSHRSGTDKTEFCELWEIHDRRTGKIIVIATGHDKFLRNEEDLLQIGGTNPFVEVSFTPRSRSFWVTPDAYYLKQAQAELSDITLQAQKHRRLSILKFLVTRGMITEEEKSRLLSSEVGALVEVEQGFDMKGGLQAFQPDSTYQALYVDAEHVRRNAREVVGFSRNQMGEYEPTGRRTATEVASVESGAQTRMTRRQLIVRNAHIESIDILNGIIFKFWTYPRMAEVVGKDGQDIWVPFVGSDLKGDYSYDVSFSSGSIENLESRRQRAIELYMGLSQDPMVDQARLRAYLAHAYNDPELKGVFTGQQDASLRLSMPQVQQSA